MTRTLALACAALLTLAGAARADDFAAEAQRSRTISVPKDKSLSFRLDAPAERIVVAQPDTAQIVATTDRSFYVRGKSVGATNLLIYGEGGSLMEVVDVRVGYDAEALQEDLAAALPGESIKVRNLGDGLLLTGEVANTSVATRAKALSDRFAPEAVTSALTVRASQQVMLEVRVLEASRTALQDIGFDINAGNSSFVFGSGQGLIGATPAQGVLRLTGGSGSVAIDTTLRALEEKGIIRTLAKPNLVALSGEKASFLAGGEFPFPVPSGRDMVSIEFRPFGVKLDFQPFVQDNGLIKLNVEPEVSSLDARTALRINGIDVPSLTVRRAGTTVELRSGESFAIAGLFQQDYANAVRQVPGAGSVPVLGALFRSSRWKRSETELVIVITPKLATAADIARTPPDPLAEPEPSAIDMILTGKTFDKKLKRSKRSKG